LSGKEAFILQMNSGYNVGAFESYTYNETDGLLTLKNGFVMPNPYIHDFLPLVDHSETVMKERPDLTILGYNAVDGTLGAPVKDFRTNEILDLGHYNIVSLATPVPGVVVNCVFYDELKIRPTKATNPTGVWTDAPKVIVPEPPKAPASPLPSAPQ
jgi:hypothetical protein